MRPLYRQLKKIEALKRALMKKLEESKKTSKPSGWEKVQTFYFTSLKVFFALLFLVLIVHAIYELFRYDLVIRPFETPVNLTRQKGYNGKVVAYRLQDYMNQIREELKRSSVPGVKGVATIQLTELQRRPEIDVPAIGLSLNAIIYQLRRMLRIPQRRVSGDVVIREGGKLYLTVRITKKPAITFPPGEVKNPEPVIKQAAEYVLKTLEPLTFGLNYCLNNKQELLTSLIKEIQHSQHDDKKTLVLTLEGCLLKNLNKSEAALNKLEQALQDESLENDSVRAVILYLKGETLLKLNKPSLAIEEYEKALALYPNNGVIYAQVAKALIKSGKTEEAFAEYEKALEKDPNNPWLYTAWGYQLAELKDFEAAEEKFQQAVAVDSNYALAYANWGDVLLRKRGEYKKAIEKFEQAVKLDPSVAWVYGNWGVALVKLGENEKALAKFEKSLDLKSTNWVYNQFEGALQRVKKPELFVQYEGVALKQKRTSSYYKRFEEVLQRLKKPALFAQYETVALKQQRASYYEKWGTVLARLKQNEAAIAKYQKALEINPNDGSYYYKWANVLVEFGKHQSEAGKYEQARLKYEQAVVNSEKAVQLGLKKRSTLAWAYTYWGDALVGLTQYEEALAKYDEALNLMHRRMHALLYNKLIEALRQFGKPEYFAQYEPLIEQSKSKILKGRYYYRWGFALAELGEYKKAIAQYQKAAELSLDTASFYGNWGNALLNMGNYGEAIAKYQLAQQKNPELNWIYGGWGIALVKLKRYEEAITQYKTALDLKPNAGIYYELGQALVKLKRYEQAIVQYEKAVELESNKRRYHYVWAKALSELRQYKEAISRYQKALEINPKHVWSRLFLGHALIQANKPNDALKQCEIIWKLGPAKATIKAAAHALCGLAQIGLNQWEAGTKSCQTALELSKKEDWAYWCLGDVRVLQNQPDEAVKQYEAAVNLKPEKAFYRYKWGQALAQLKQYDAAITQFEKAVELDKDGEIGKQALAKIEALKDESL
jgi:tetratricopeptide (TPR) repeat protein